MWGWRRGGGDLVAPAETAEVRHEVGGPGYTLREA